MITYIEGDVLRSNAEVICHQVNCKSVMGAGLAKQIATQYPVVFQEYCIFLKTHTTALGEISSSFVSKNRTIVNMYAQFDYGKTGVHTDYKAFLSCLKKIKERYSGSTIAFPYKIGCGLAGGDWSIIEPLIEQVLSKEYVEIWRLPNDTKT